MAKHAEQDPSSSKTARRGTTLWLCIIFFVSAWMFVLGVLVGRGTAPVHFDIESLQKELAALKEAVQKKELQWYKNRSEAVPDKPDLEFHEALKKHRIEPRLELDTGRSEKLAENQKKITPSPEKKTEPVKPIEVPKIAPVNSETAGGFTIQVAALKEAKYADAKVTELIRKGYPAYRTVGEVPNQGTWYRVRIGSFKDKMEAFRMMDRLKKEKINGIIVRK